MLPNNNEEGDPDKSKGMLQRYTSLLENGATAQKAVERQEKLQASLERQKA